jgi:hypothetical protein
MKKITNFQNIMLINAVFFKFCLNAIGGFLGMIFLWQQNLVGAIVFGLPPIILGTLVSKFYLPFDPNKIAKTFLGKIFLCYSQGAGLTLYLSSHLVIPVSFWFQSNLGIFFGLLLLAFGLIPSWKKYF